MKEKFLEKYNYFYHNNLIFTSTIKYLTEIERKEILDAIEHVLLEDKDLTEIKEYKFLENLKKDKEYLIKYKKSLKYRKEIFDLLDKIGSKKITPDCFIVYSLVYDHIDSQINDLSNKRKKLDVIDEFARISRYTNDDRIWTSGVHINIKDINNNIPNWSSILTNKEKSKKNSIGVLNNNFINFFSDDYIYNSNFKKHNTGLEEEYYKIKNHKYCFTEEEKQNIYLLNNQEFPYNYKILCNDIFDLKRPLDTISCNKEFILKKENIYKDSKGNYLVVCPTCGCINYIEKEILDYNTINYIDENYNEVDELINYKQSEIKILTKKKSK